MVREPELRYTPKGTALMDIALAINRRYTLPDGVTKREETTFVDITMWGRNAELIAQYVKKGQPLYVEGRLHQESWEDKQTGQKRSKMKVVGESMQFLGSQGSGGGSPQPSQASAQQTNQQEPPAGQAAHPQGASAYQAADDDEDLDDIPF